MLNFDRMNTTINQREDELPNITANESVFIPDVETESTLIIKQITLPELLSSQLRDTFCWQIHSCLNGGEWLPYTCTAIQYPGLLMVLVVFLPFISFYRYVVMPLSS